MRSGPQDSEIVDHVFIPTGSTRTAPRVSVALSQTQLTQATCLTLDIQFSLQTCHPGLRDSHIHVLSGQGGMLLACSAILHLISPEQNLSRIGIMDQATHNPDLNQITHMAMAAHLKVTHALLTPDWQMITYASTKLIF